MYEIMVDYAPDQAENSVISEGVFAAHADLIGEKDKSFSVFLKNDAGQVFGGVQASFDTESVYIDLLWVDETLRNKGYGKQLLNAVEKEAVKNGCQSLTVDTWDFQAEEFYLKNGYQRIGEVKNYWKGHSKIFLRKTIQCV